MATRHQHYHHKPSSKIFCSHEYTGDVVLAHLNCYVCRAIEIEENSTYSHSGLVLSTPNEETSVMESISGVNTVPLHEFRKRVSEITSPILVLRPRFLHETGAAQNWSQIFQKEFFGKPFDHDFSWSNRDAGNQEMFYCSEFVVKFLNRVSGAGLTPKRMHFDRLENFWSEYFHGRIPHGEPGWSPQDFVRDPQFEVLGTLGVE
jgi:Permuted papain-like amidase enzyme, YaeF/YiiX, C92 family